MFLTEYRLAMLFTRKTVSACKTLFHCRKFFLPVCCLAVLGSDPSNFLTLFQALDRIATWKWQSVHSVSWSKGLPRDKRWILLHFQIHAFSVLWKNCIQLKIPNYSEQRTDSLDQIKKNICLVFQKGCIINVSNREVGWCLEPKRNRVNPGGGNQGGLSPPSGEEDKQLTAIRGRENSLIEQEGDRKKGQAWQRGPIVHRVRITNISCALQISFGHACRYYQHE